MDKKIVRSFEDLIVWQRAIEFVKQVYVITNQGDLKRDFGLRDQMRRAALSIPTNIAEGFERVSRKEYLLFLNIAKGSAVKPEVCFESFLRLVTLARILMTSFGTAS